MAHTDYRGFSPQYATSVVVPTTIITKDIPQGHYSKETINGKGFPVLDDVYSKHVSRINPADRHYSVATSGVVSCLVELTKTLKGFTKTGFQRGQPLCPIDEPFEIEGKWYSWFQVQLF